MTQIRTIPGVSNAVTDFSDGLRSEGRDVVTDAHIVPIRGAEGDGTTNDTTAINTWIAADKIKILPYGDYLAPGSVTSFSHPTIILADNAKESGSFLPFLTITDPTIGFKSTPQVLAFVYQNTTNRNDLRTVDIRRVVNTDDGHTNPHALHVETTKNDSNDSTEWAIAGVIHNYSNTAANGDAAVNGVANKHGTASTFGGHFQANEQYKTTADTAVTPIIAAEMNIQAIGLDHPTDNHGYGNRRVLDIIAKTNTGVSGWDTATNNYGQAEIGVGWIVRNDDTTDAYFRYGGVIDDQDSANKITTALYIHTAGGKSIELAGNVTGTHFLISGNGTNGVILNGTYSGIAMRVNSGQYIGMENTSTVKMGYGVTANVWGFYNASTLRFGINMSDGVVQFGTHSALAAETVTGYITIKDAAGNNRKVAVVS